MTHSTLLLHIAQVTQVAIPHDVLSSLWAGLQTLILAGVAYIARTLRSTSERCKRVEIILTGVDGDNGLRSDVEKLKTDRDRQAITLATCPSRHSEFP